MPSLSIVLPCYNPGPNWELKVLEGYQSISNYINATPEIILVNDGSSIPIDKDAIIFLSKQIPNFSYSGYELNQGKGAALRHGINAATGDYIIFTDIDFPYTQESIYDIWLQLQEDKDIVIGIKDKSYYQHVPTTRRLISKLLRALSKKFLNIPVTDTQCGLKGFNQKGKQVFLATTINRYLCDLEFVYKSFKTKPGLMISTQEIKLKEGVKFSKMNTKILFAEFYNFLKILIKL